MNSLGLLKRELKTLGSLDKAKILQYFFKTKPGQYGAGDVFLGVTVPLVRQVAKKYSNLKLSEVSLLLKSKFHEFRLTALLILVLKYEKATDLKTKKEIVDFYLNHSFWINNWDLVDLSVYKILGNYLLTSEDKDDILNRLASSSYLWERRMAIVSTYAFIKSGRYQETFLISKKLMKDDHDLIHKAIGWMLREVGKRISKEKLENFLIKNISGMPRVSLRYALEHFSQKDRQYFLKK